MKRRRITPISVNIKKHNPTLNFAKKEVFSLLKLNMSSFKLKTEDTEFKDRQKKIFDQLKVLENNRKNTCFNKDVSEQNDNKPNRAHKSEMRQFRGKESIFKRPQNPAPKNYINRIPDFKKNPHKWTKYSLEDVQDVTEESNKKSAMDFLKELANRKKLEQGFNDDILEELPTKIMFNKHVKPKTLVTDKAKNFSEEQITDLINDKPSFTNSKLVMPEYVIGQKPVKKDKNIKRSKVEKGTELKLDHLMFEDE